MRVILLERVAKLGQMGDVVDVKPGYARNFLLPNGKALEASKANIETFEEQVAQLEARNIETKKEAEAVSSQLDGKQFIIIRSASDSGSLYGSVSSRDISETVTAHSFTIDRKQVYLRYPIKELGVHRVELHLHPEVVAEIEVNIARSAEEAELQATGKSIFEIAEEESEFEISELFDDIGAAASDDDLHKVSPHGTEPELVAEVDVQLERPRKLSKQRTLSDFIVGLSDAQKVQISVTSDHLNRELVEISERAARINELLSLN